MCMLPKKLAGYLNVPYVNLLSDALHAVKMRGLCQGDRISHFTAF